jgi:4-amino-4-deoxy-L-arabinose transferase-like glycosyltransferase
MTAFASLLAIRARPLLIGIFLILAAGFAIAVISGDKLRYDDELRYHILADSVLHKHVYESVDGVPTAWWPPGYPVAISAAYAIVDRPLSAKFLNVICLALATLAAAVLARRQHYNGMLIAPYLALCYPILLYTASTLYPQTLGSLLILWVIYLVSADTLTRTKAAAAGFVYGLLCLTIPAFLMLFPLVLAFIVFDRRDRLKQRLTKAAIVAAVAFMTVVPWTLRNFAQFHAFVPVSTNSGFNLALGNSALTQPDSKPDLTVLCAEAANSPSEIAFDRSMTHCATSWITRHPAQAASLYVSKVLNYFNYRNQLATQSETAAWTDWVMFVSYYPLLLLAIVRLLLVRKFALSRTEMLLYLLYFGNALASAVFFTRLRFRIPFDLLLIVIDSAFLARAFDLLRQRPAARPSPASG